MKLAQRFSAATNVSYDASSPVRERQNASFVLPDSIALSIIHPALKRRAITIPKAVRRTKHAKKFLVCNRTNALLMKRVPRVSA